MVLTASTYPLLDLFWTMLEVFFWVLWFWLLIVVFGDVFTRKDIGGWAKTGWVVLVVLVPVIGSLIYLISQGRGMADRNAHAAMTSQKRTEEYIRSVAAPNSSGIDELAEAKARLDRGEISPEQFDEVKRRVLARAA